jgi:peptidoglycan/LPS O-acetylase OafA/YrhL
VQEFSHGASAADICRQTGLHQYNFIIAGYYVVCDRRYAACRRLGWQNEVRMTFQDRLVSVSFRGPGFDQIRLLAATIVLLHHCRGIQYPKLQLDPLHHFSGGYMDFGRFAVVIFFAISGFLVTPGLVRSCGYIDYGVNRTARIFPGLIVNVVLTMLVLGPLLTTHSLTSYFTDPDLYLYAKNISTLTVNYLPGVVSPDGSPLIVNGALWTLHFEVLCYIALVLFAAVGLLGRRSLFVALWFVSYAIYIAISMDPTLKSALTDRLLTFDSRLERLLTFDSLFVYFGCGALLYLFREHIPFSRVLAGAALALVLAALPLGAGAIVMPICLPYIVIFCGLSSLPGKGLLRHDLSYGVYLIHAPLLIAFGLAFPNMHIWWIGAAAVFLVTLVLAYVSWTFVEGPALRKKKVVSNWIHRRIELIMPPLRAPVRPPAAE